MYTHESPIALIGAGPIGLETAVELTRAGLEYVHLERAQIGATIMQQFPPATQFFSSIDRIALAGVPIPLVERSKCTREEYLAYLRGIVMQFGLEIRRGETVLEAAREPEGRYMLRTLAADGEHLYRVHSIIFAIGDMTAPRILGIPGEDLPHVRHILREPHEYFQRALLVVGGKNSAVESALRCHTAGARVTISYRRASFNEKSVKYWLLPDISGKIERGEITAHFETVPVEITPTGVALRRVGDGNTFHVDADAILLQTGYVGDMSLLKSLGVTCIGIEERPLFHEETMETDIPNVYVAGTVTAGTQSSYKVFIENCHIHATRIAAALSGHTPPRSVEAAFAPES